MSADFQTFSLPLDRFDPDLLPADARTPGTQAFRDAVNEVLLGMFRDFRGRATVSVNDDRISVSWTPDAAAASSPLDVAITHLRNGRTAQGVQVLEFLLTANPEDVNVLFNLGLALSEARRFAEAEDHLARAVELAPDFVNALVALGVAQLRQQNNEVAVENLERAVALEPNNQWANRNLGIALLKLGDDAEKAALHLRRAVESQLRDQGAWLALGDALSLAEERQQAADAYRQAIAINPHNDLAEVARSASSRLAQDSIQRAAPAGAPRPDAVEYCVAAIKEFRDRPLEQVKRIAFEIAALGRDGIDVNDPAKRYRLDSLPGEFSGLQIVCLMYVGFQLVAPGTDVGIDLDSAYEQARESVLGTASPVKAQRRMKCHPNIYTEREQDAGWHVVQAATLLREGIDRKRSSFIIYAALELRMAIEQIFFTIIVLAADNAHKIDLVELRKKDALTKKLDEISPRYTLRCRFSNALSSFYPHLPKTAEWDVKTLKRHFTELSFLCHSQLHVLEVNSNPEKWAKVSAEIEEVYWYLAERLAAGTGVLHFHQAHPIIESLWKRYSEKEIDLESVKRSYAIAKPAIDAEKGIIQRP
jgi:Flp pilus assembly protein TadD